jgi:ParB family chromosome partitioning protein
MVDFSKSAESFLNRLDNQDNVRRKGTVLELDGIVLPESQPRRYFDPKKLEELKNSIKQHGILEPVIVRPVGNQKYELVAGERRYRAARELNLQEIPVTIRNLSDNQALQIALIENLQREDLNPVEETKGILKLLAIELQTTEDEIKSLIYKVHNDTVDLNNDVVTKKVEVVQGVFLSIGKITLGGFVQHRLTLLKLPADILDAIEQGLIEYTKAKEIARIKDEGQRQSLLTEAIANNLTIVEIRKRITQIKAAGAEEKRALEELDSHQTRLKAIQSKLKKLSWSKLDKKIEFEELLAKLEELVKVAEEATSN